MSEQHGEKLYLYSSLFINVTTDTWFVILQINRYWNTFISGSCVQPPLCYIIWQQTETQQLLIKRKILRFVTLNTFVDLFVLNSLIKAVIK